MQKYTAINVKLQKRDSQRLITIHEDIWQKKKKKKALRTHLYAQAFPYTVHYDGSLQLYIQQLCKDDATVYQFA